MPNPKRANKTHIAIQVDTEILIGFKYKAKSTGDNYQALMNHALKQYMQRESIADIIRKTIQQELKGRIENPK